MGGKRSPSYETTSIDYEMLYGDIIERKDAFVSRKNELELQVSDISVPRGYSRELYNMRIHIFY